MRKSVFMWSGIIVLVGLIALMGRLSNQGAPNCGCGGTCGTMPPAQVASSASIDDKSTKPISESPVTASIPRLLDLGADKCMPCKMMAPVLDELRKEHKGKLKVEFIDVWKNRDAAESYQIKSIPTQVFFDKDGKEFYRHEGFMPKADIIKIFEEHKIRLSEE